MQKYWFFVLGAIFNSKDFSCSFLDFGSRLKTCRRGWHFDNLACRNIDFSFWAQFLIRNFPSSFVDFPFSSVTLNLSVFCHKCEGRTFLQHQHLKRSIEDENVWSSQKMELSKLHEWSTERHVIYDLRTRKCVKHLSQTADFIYAVDVRTIY